MRELGEETGLSEAHELVRGVWQLEEVHPYFVMKLDAIVLSPRFCVEVDRAWSPTLSQEHDAFRWTQEHTDDAMFLWPGQRAAVQEVGRILRGSAEGEWQRK
jgi:hypothetical protein